MQDRYSFSTAALYPLETEDALKRIRRAGFRHAELMPQCLSDASEQRARAFEQTGVHIASIHFPLAFFPMLYTPHASMREDGRRFTEKLLLLGERLGASVLVVHPHEKNRRGHDELLEQPVVDNLRWLADAGQTHGILLAMENSPKTCATPEQLLSYVEMLGNGNVRPMTDTTEVCEAGGDPAAFIAALPPCHLHLSDYCGETKHLPAGEGEIDWASVRAALGEDYAGFYTLEPAYRFYLDDVDDKLAKARAFLERTFPV